MTKAAIKRTMETLYKGGDSETYEALYKSIHTLCDLGLLGRDYLDMISKTDGELYLDKLMKEDGFTDEWIMDAPSSDK